jgi:colanic acid biosynthesis protein WcaH
MYLEKETFKTVIASTPLISIDLIVKNTQGEYLLGYRTNQPAKNSWFVPGGRILKDESMDDAFVRLCKNELGLSATRQKAKFLGPYEHFYQDYVFGDDVTTHYVVLGYEIVVDVEITALPNEQHNQYKWFTKDELLTCENVHLHSKWYVG